MIEWASIFDDFQIEKGASEDEIAAFAKNFAAPLSAQDINDIRASTPENLSADELCNQSIWRLPNKPFPKSFLHFLMWSNGGWCRRGEREFQFLGTADLRTYTLIYQFPRYLPDAIPFALNGGGVFYVFDMREDPQNGEYPILGAAAGVLDYEESKFLAHSFIEVCRGTTDIEEIVC